MIKKGFSVAEAMIALLIGSIALGMAAPMITKQVKSQSLADSQMQILQDQINELRENQSNIDSGAVMFFRRTSCPDGWSIIKNKGGYYLRIAQVNENGDIEESKNIGDTLEAMVHKHKHVSPFMAFNGPAMKNQLRYGPYKPEKDAQVDYSYPEAPSEGSAYAFYGVGYRDEWYANTFTYTSDGMNREESLYYSIKDAKKVTVCPNRDDDNKICKPSDNNFNIPYLSEMPIVGDENRPKSILLIACEKN